MLEEIWIQILVESVLKFDVTFLPIDFITEWYTRPLHQL